METVHRGNNDGVIAICPKSGGENPWREEEGSRGFIGSFVSPARWK